MHVIYTLNMYIYTLNMYIYVRISIDVYIYIYDIQVYTYSLRCPIVYRLYAWIILPIVVCPLIAY